RPACRSACKSWPPRSRKRSCSASPARTSGPRTGTRSGRRFRNPADHGIVVPMRILIAIFTALMLAAGVAPAGTSNSLLDVSADPYGVVASPDGRRLWVTHDHPASVSEIDSQARTVVRTMPVGPNARGIVLAPDGDSLLVTEFLTAKLHRLDLASGRVTHTW